MKTKMENADIAGSLEKFQDFLIEMDDVLELFVATAQKAGFQLDYSLSSVDSLERFISEHNSRTNDSQFENRAARYLGEVFRKNLGGKWELCIKDSRHLYYKLPVITGHATMPIEFCPIEVVSGFIAAKTPGLFRRAIDGHVEFLRRV